MSNSLVRASLDLINFENDLKNDKRKKKNRAKNILHLIPSNHRNIINKNKKADLSNVFHNPHKITVHEAKKHLAKKTDATDDNVHKLLLLGSNKIDSNAAKKLFERGVKKRAILEEEQPQEEEKTAFTEEDFQNFEKEYFTACK